MNQLNCFVLLLTLLFSNVLCTNASAQTKKKTNGPRLSVPDNMKSQKVMLRTQDGFYLSALLGGGDGVVADNRNPSTSEVFTIEWVSTSSIRLRTRDSYYVGARLGGGESVDATVKVPRTSEVFQVEWQDKEKTMLRLRTREGFYIHPVDGGGAEVDARIKAPTSTEVLTIVPM